MAVDFAALASPGVAGLRRYRPGMPEATLHRRLGLPVDSILKLASNENPLGPSPRAVAALRGELGALHRYPDASGHELKRALAGHLGVDSERIVLGCGSNELLLLLAQSFLSAATSAIYSQHAFVVYPIAVGLSGAAALVAPARDWGADPVAILQLLRDDTRLIFIANPNNPTGTWLDTAALEGLLAALPPTVILVLDEAYCEYVEQADYPDGLALARRFPNLALTRTFSKLHGLAGLRVGYAIVDPVLADMLERVRAPFSVSSVAQTAALAALDDDAHQRRSRAVNRAGREQLAAGFAALGVAAIPSAGNFISFATPAGDAGAARVHRALLAVGIIVRPVAEDYALPGHLRVTIGTEADNQRFLTALASALGGGR